MKKKKNNLSFADWLSVIIAFIGALIFGAAFIGCYVWFFRHPSLSTFFGVSLASSLPGFLAYGIFSALVEFLSGKLKSIKK